MNIKFRENIDSSFELYNEDVGDIYFSNVGAYKEALEKFVFPSLPVIKNKSNVKILDVCFGMGYNSKTFLNYILKNNINLSCEIDAIDIDEKILTLGLLIFDEHIDDKIHFLIGNKILSSLNFEKSMTNILGENWINYFLMKIEQKFKVNFDKNGIDLYSGCKISAFLHNIYYQNQINMDRKLKLNLKIENLLNFLPKVTSKYDLIFHDAFSILKQPELWSDYVIEHYYNILNKNGRFLTYSNSRILRKRLASVGFAVEINYDINGKQNGTIGIKN